jgi:hypothetical protein
MESELCLENHDGMPDTVLCSLLPYIIYLLFVVFGVFTIRIHSTVGEGVVSRKYRL